MIGKLYGLIVDCPDPHGLARLYALGGLPIPTAEPDWVTLGDSSETQLHSQLPADTSPPRWPDPAHPQQLHLDFTVEDMDSAEQQVLALGATRLPSDEDPAGCRTFADQAGHPFCLVLGSD